MPPIITNSKDSQGHRDKFLIPVEISCQSKYSCEMWKLLYLSFKSLTNVIFLKVGQKFKYQEKDIITQKYSFEILKLKHSLLKIYY